MTTDPRNPGPHSRACGIRPHPHGVECSRDCPTCGGSVFVEDEAEDQPEPTRRVSLSVLTTTRQYLESDVADWTEEEIDATRELLRDFDDLKYLMLVIGGSEVNLNPRYLVSVTINFHDDKEK